MTIIIGGTGLNGANTQITVPPPRQFDTINGLRMANNSAAHLLLNNVISSGQQQEYLLSGQQMVWRLENISAVITVIPLSGAVTDVSLLVEWSDDAETDFIGQYPAAFTVQS